MKNRFLLGAMAACFAATPLVRADVVTLQPSRDTTIYEDSVDLSNGMGIHVFVGKNGGGFARRALLYFDIAGAIPAGSTIESVSLQMYMSRTRAGSNTVRLHRLTNDWGEGASDAEGAEGGGGLAQANDATWEYRFFVVNPPLWTSDGGDFVASPSASAVVGGTGFYTWISTSAFVADVQFWLDNPSSNFGMIAIGDESEPTTAKRFESRHNNNVSRRPMLSITFTPPVVEMGACCFNDGSCMELTSVDCASMGGTFQGGGTTCDPNPCQPVTGACCFNDGSCLEMTEADCAAMLGTYQGDDTLCVNSDCPVVLEKYVDALPIPPAMQPVSGMPGGAAVYDIPIVQFEQQLHRDLPPTTLWGYNGTFPAATIEAASGVPIIVNWINDLRDEMGNLRTDHLLPIDLCPHGAEDLPKVVTHVHGGHVPAEVDGYPEDTFLPGQGVTYEYPNNQDAATLWFHDHALGITRINVMLGMAGFYIIRDANENALGLPFGEFEIPVAIQDRSFNTDGSLKYHEMWHEHFFGDTFVVNGKAWPFLNVKQGKYRFRLLNGCNSRALTLALSNAQSFTMIGNEGGLFEAPLVLSEVTLGPAERADVIIDFQGHAPGTEIILTNSAPAPFPGTPGVGVLPEVMKFIVTADPGDTDPIPGALRVIEELDPMDSVQTRQLELRKFSTDPCTGDIWLIDGHHWEHITEIVERGSTEIWEFVNRSGISHPMHMHLVYFQVLNREGFTVGGGGEIIPDGNISLPEPFEQGWKDTVMAHPNEIVRVIARFDDYLGLYPYHCHILEHEDHEMMRQFRVVPAPCPGDVDGNGLVNVNDITYIVFRLGTTGSDGDADGNGMVDVNDITYVVFRLGTPCP